MLPTMTWGHALSELKIVDLDLRPGEDTTTKRQPQQMTRWCAASARNPLIGHFTLDEGFREV